QGGRLGGAAAQLQRPADEIAGHSDGRAAGAGQRIRARRTASSSHWLAARRTSSFAGRPFGNSAPSSASRLTAPLELFGRVVALRCVAERVRVAVCARGVW